MKENKGITMVVLIITIVILLILAGISINAGDKMIQASKLENIKVNMLSIKAKGKEFVEKANFTLGTNYDSITDEDEKNLLIENVKSNFKGAEIKESGELSENLGITDEQFQEDKNNLIFYYKLSSQNLMDMGISNVESDKKNGRYIIKYDIKNVQVEVYNDKGFEKNGNTYYSLNQIEKLEF